MPAPESFTTARLNARRPDETDEQFVADMWDDSRVTDWLGGGRDRDGVRSLFSHWDALWTDGTMGVWILRTRQDDERVGWILLHPMDFGGHRGVEVGWAIAADRWREGFASEAARRVVEIAFVDCGLTELISGTMVGNVASRGVMEKIGFAYDRDVVHADLPHVLYRLDRETWEGSRG